MFKINAIVIIVILFTILKTYSSYKVGKGYGPSQKILNPRAIVESSIDPKAQPVGKNYGVGARLSKTAPKTPITTSSPPPVSSSSSSVTTTTTITPKVVTPAPVKVEAPKAQLIEETPIKFEAPVQKEVEEAKPTLNIEESLKLGMVEETANRVNRIKELSQLQSQLSKSMSRKAEVDGVISRELESLRPRLANEVKKESSRVEQLEQLLKTFNSALTAKLSMIDSELSILSQMRDVRNKITEKAILNELDGALTKKSELIEIEKDIAKEINSSASNLEAEIADARVKLGTLASVLASFPVGEDLESTRQYTWADVDKLQAVLAGSIDASLERDNKVQQFIQTYDEAMKKRGIILGVTASTTFSKVSSNAVRKVKSTREPSPDINELVTLLKKKSNDELIQTASDAAKNTAQSLISASASLIGAASSFTTSSEAEEGKKSLFLAGESAGDFGNSIQNFFGAIKSAWKGAVGDTPIESGSTDEYVSKVVKGVQAVLADKGIKDQANNVVNSVTKGSKEITNAVSVTTSGVSNRLSDSDKWDNAVSELFNNAGLLLSAITVGVNRVYENNLDRQLPSGKN